MDRKDWPTSVYPFETPNRDDRVFYAALTPAERIRIMIELLPPEHRERWPDRVPRITRRP